MAFQFDVNQLPGSGAAALYQLKETLKAAGWTVMASGDGLALYGAASDVIASGAAGAGGMNNVKAWFRIRMPGSTREFTFQRGTNATDLRLKYSVDGFTGGAPSAVQCPSAADEQIALAGGTDAAPTGTNFCGTINRVSCWADNAAPYGWGIHGWSAAGATTFALVLDAMAAGSYPATDIDPYVLQINQNSPNFGTWADSNNTATHTCWYAKGLGGASWQGTYTAAPSYFSSTFVNTLPVNLSNGKDDDLPMFYGRPTTYGWKGTSHYLRWTSIARANLSTHSTTGVKDRLVIGAATIPWAGIDPLL